MYRTRAIIYKGNLNIIKLIQVKDNLEQNYVILVYNKPLVIILLFQLNIDFGFGFVFGCPLKWHHHQVGRS